MTIVQGKNRAQSNGVIQLHDVQDFISRLAAFMIEEEQDVDFAKLGRTANKLMHTAPRAPFLLGTMSLTKKVRVQKARVNKVSSDGEGYAFEIANKSGVVPYQPEIPEPAYFDKNATSKDYFLHKLVNAERASYKAPGVAPKISRTRSVLLYDVAERFLLK
ncbi:hypothetical protein MP228_000523 [Amoeboaphelidium protococcarum]|nr:hypothetical protein MP228_000523 [Amoeboaphelidium protococcarum]